ncbi:hypothetical protein D3C78_1203990 [compost metagenome]
MTRVERHLFVFGKEIIGVAVEYHFANQLYRDQLFRDELGGIEQVKIKFELILLRNQLQPKLVFRIIARLDRLP